MVLLQGSAMSFMDFKDFPIFAVGNRTFTEQLVKVSGCGVLAMVCVIVSGQESEGRRGRGRKREDGRVIDLCLILLQCFTDNNLGLTGGVSDYPLCSIELYADMDAAVDTPTCFRRG